MSAKHTPGPWKVDEENNRILASDPRGMIVCHLAGTVRNPVVMADAQLIVAAPDLLTACQKALGVLAGADMNKQALIDALALCRAAIEKSGAAA